MCALCEGAFVHAVQLSALETSVVRKSAQEKDVIQESVWELDLL